MEIQENTTELFIQDKKCVIEYLKSRKVNNNALFSVINDYPFGLLRNARFFVDEEEYEITHFLSKSNNMGYDIHEVNKLLNTESTNVVAFAMVAGDDVLCYDTKSKEVFLWLIQTRDGEKIHVSDNLTKFLKQFK